MSSPSSNNNNQIESKDESMTDTELPEEPTNCCMSGCENCVWKQYALDLIHLYDHSNEEAKKKIMAKIKDPTLQVFINMELQFLDHHK
ncbi:hypothetical protein PVAND_009664 [Polypedilum vanderplanki]|uniref:Oxidoreductase-like domain-containing protein n=1 Tax=Polypedilum vanderplanki TaxID=319348 RepID=A0A9J6CED2_POLVA|nr:hypothetical protein PVAND_009664 [Polypedilum vanderplanki]